MKKELITELLQKFEAACCEVKGVECWSAGNYNRFLITLNGEIF
ncbi:hypothetical protein [Niabella agricola]|nr:hypothetical protein [Niabella agricola]